MVVFLEPPAPKTLAAALGFRRQIRDHLGHLAAEVDATKRSAAFSQALEMTARFWRYSPFNQWLILAQRPTARRVAGRRTWEALGRRIRRGASPLAVLAPAVRRRLPFIVVPVYDISQTIGRRLASLSLTLRGAAPEARLLERAAAHLCVTVVRADLPRGVQGQSACGVVTLRRRLPGAERAATLAHELAHEILHTMRSRGPEANHVQLETEAEATSYVVMRALGLPSKAPAYIAWRGGSGDLVLQSMKRVQRASRRIMAACERTRQRRAGHQSL